MLDDGTVVGEVVQVAPPSVFWKAVRVLSGAYVIRMSSQQSVPEGRPVQRTEPGHAAVRRRLRTLAPSYFPVQNAAGLPSRDVLGGHCA